MTLKMKERLTDWEPYIYLGLIIMLTVSMSVLVGVYIHQNHQIKETAKTAKTLAAAIQKNRLDVIRTNCEDQNVRHNRAIVALYDLLGKSGVKPSRLDKAAEPIIEVIDALAPSQNCAKVVAAAQPKKALGEPKPDHS